MDESFVNLVLYLVSLALKLSLLIVLSITTIRLVRRGKKKKWVNSFTISFLMLAILIHVLLVITVYENQSKSILSVLFDALRVLPAMFIDPAWLTIILLLLLCYVIQKKKSKESISEEQPPEYTSQSANHSMIWFTCTLTLGIIPTAWLHLQYSRDGSSPYLIILLVWIMLGMFVPFVVYIKQKHRTK